MYNFSFFPQIFKNLEKLLSFGNQAYRLDNMIIIVDKPVRMVSEPRIYAKYGKDRGFCNLIATGGKFSILKLIN